MWNRFITILGMMATLLSPNGVFSQKGNGEAEIEIKVFDRNNSFIEEAKIALQNENKQQFFPSISKDGIYKMYVPSGFYTLRITKKGFCPESRGIFEIKPAEKIWLNARLTVCAIEDVLVVGKNDNSEIYSKYRVPFKEDNIKVNGFKFPVQIKYSGRDVTGNNVLYNSNKVEDEVIRVTVNYNKNSVISDSVVFYPQENSLRASGNVIFEDGTYIRKFKSVNLKIGNDSLEVLESNQ